MIERVGKEFPTLFICVQSRVSPAPSFGSSGAVLTRFKAHKKSGEPPPFNYLISLDVPD